MWAGLDKKVFIWTAAEIKARKRQNPHLAYWIDLLSIGAIELCISSLGSSIKIP